MSSLGGRNAYRTHIWRKMAIYATFGLNWGGPYGRGLMKFTLTYDGELPATGNGNSRVKEKWSIRKAIDPQLRELWSESQILKSVLQNRLVPKTGFVRTETHHSVEVGRDVLAGFQMPQRTERLDLCDPIQIGSRRFLPIVRESLALKCGLKIKFLRKEPPGQIIYQGGDMDNRLKTLFDALAVPTPEQIVEDADTALVDPIHCLLEDDRMITGIEVETQKLLSRPNASPHEVRLIIDVDIRIIQTKSYNQAFLGD